MSSEHIPTPPNPAVKPAAPQPARRMSKKTIFALVLLAVALAFVFSNLNNGTIMFLGFRFDMPVWIWFLGVLLVGVVIGSLFPWFRGKRKQK